MSRYLLLAACVTLAHAQLSSFYSGEDAAAAAALSAQHLTSTGASLAPMDAFYAAQVFTGESPSAACEAMAAAVGTSLPLTDLSFAVRAADALGCAVPATDAMRDAVTAGFGSDEVADIAAAVAAAPLLRVDVPWEGVVSSVSALIMSSGSVRASAGASPSADAAGDAFSVLAAAAEAGHDAGKTYKGAVRAVARLAAKASGPEDGPLYLGSGEGRLLATARVVSSGMRLVAAAKASSDVTPDTLAGFAAFFLQHRTVQDAATAGIVALGLRGVAAAPVAPVAVTLATPALSHGSTDPVLIRVTDVFGEPIGEAAVVLDTATRVGDAAALISDIALDAASGSEYALNLGAAHPAPGVYELQLGVTPSSDGFGEVDGVLRMLQVSTSLKLSTAHVQVTGGDSGPSTTTATYPDATKSVLTAGSSSRLNILFDTLSDSGDALRPHQVFVRLTHSTSGVSTVFVAIPDSSPTSGSHRVSLDVGNRASLHEAGEAGTYAVDVIVGDTTIHNPTVWRIGSVTLQPPAAPAKPDDILYSKPLLHESDTTLKALPEIHHQFRTPDSRPPTIVSRAFTLLAFFPLIFLWLNMLRNGANFGVISSLRGAGFIWASVFHLSLLALLVLIVVYWLNLDMFTFLTYLTVPAAVCGLSGVYLFRSILASKAKPHAD